MIRLPLNRVRYSSKLAIDSSNLEFSNRNADILESLLKYYPSMTELGGNDVLRVKEFKERYGNFEETQLNELHDSITINGRIKRIRFSGKKMVFIDLVEDSNDIQLILNYNEITDNEHFESKLTFLKRGDYIQSYGVPRLSRSKMKNLSLRCNKLPVILAPAQMPLPLKLTDVVKAKSNKVANYQINGVGNLLIRNSVIKSIRKFLEQRDFVEVETPIMSSKSNGAIAKPFKTSSKDFSELLLRVAPELWLKRLIVGGFSRVFEIGKSFRNEGIDGTHNPEFTTLEFYQSYLSMDGLIEMNEILFKQIIQDLFSNELLESYIPESTHELKKILEDNKWKFQKIEFLPTLSKELGVDLSSIDFENPSKLISVIPHEVRKQHLGDETNLSSSHILNKLCGVLIEEKYCKSLLPTLIYHHPAVISPLAKSNPSDVRTTKRFELFISGREYTNAYEEENCPQAQLQKFEQQAQLKEDFNDNETLNSIDHEYINAMKWGMPPIGGFGLGVDRLCMLLTGAKRIEEVLSFGSIDDVNRQ